MRLWACRSIFAASSIDGVRATIAGPTEDRRELLITGEIVNLRQAETPVPNLRLTLRGDDRRELYLWTAREPKSRLGPHERVAFRARLAAPPAGRSRRAGKIRRAGR